MNPIIFLFLGLVAVLMGAMIWMSNYIISDKDTKVDTPTHMVNLISDK